MQSMNSTNPKSCIKAAINQLTTIDVSQLYDYDVISTQQCIDNLPQNSMFQQNCLVMNQRQCDSNCYDHQQAYRDPVQPSQLQTGHFYTNVQFKGQIFNNQADGCLNYQHRSYKSSRQDTYCQNDQYSRDDTTFQNSGIREDVYPKDYYNVYDQQKQFENPQQLDTSKLMRQNQIR